MGQTIQVSVTPVGAATVFATDRSITGQDGVTYRRTDAAGELPPAVLARRLFAVDDRIDHVHVISNVVTARRDGGWDDDSLQSATAVVRDLFLFYPSLAAPEGGDADEDLRRRHYNATLSHIRAHNPELWVIKVRPDEAVDPFQAGQYTTLALGYWEPRADDAVEEFTPAQREKLARRSYSVSSSIVDETGELVESHPDEIEFYIVMVRPGQEEIPALTPRLFTKKEGDRIFMGRKFTGHYTLEGVSPDDNVVFLSTGTGEAPQNAMTAELLRREHPGRILNLVCVRYRDDLAYTEQQAKVMDRWGNYRYVAITTREPENVGSKVYIQDLIVSGRVEEELGAPLDPESTHVFLCGNPAMIGLPRNDGEEMEFPQPVGVCQLLHERGFTIDRRRRRGNVHYEEYWKDR